MRAPVYIAKPERPTFLSGGGGEDAQSPRRAASHGADSSANRSQGGHDRARGKSGAVGRCHHLGMYSRAHVSAPVALCCRRRAHTCGNAGAPHSRSRRRNVPRAGGDLFSSRARRATRRDAQRAKPFRARTPHRSRRRPAEQQRKLRSGYYRCADSWRVGCRCARAELSKHFFVPR